MRSTTTVILTAISLGWLVAASRASDLVPQQVITIQGEEMPVYAPGQVQPTRIAAPRFPAGQRRNGYALLIADGRVLQSEVKESRPSKEFGESAGVALKRWRFPVQKWNGRASKYVVTVPFDFEVE